jgi:hypothetical protein
MPFFRGQNWTAAEIPDLKCREDRRIWVDIGFLSGDEHRQAFVLIFSRMMSDNAATLSGMELVAIEAKRPIPLTTLAITAPMSLDCFVTLVPGPNRLNANHRMETARSES